ncbi:MAG TPA: ABC transporter ATP-binding protein [Pyrinomonadaceae bacterium]|nr:ABC transporter ATP-binding protein [Pyrinomonadaceae bacterium]
MLTARNISVQFGDRDIVRDVSISAGAGEIVALLGPNGAGKTTLLRTLNGAVTRSGGEVVIDEVPIEKMSRRDVARRIAVVAQENETQFPVSVMEFILAGRFARGSAFGWESDDDKGAANRALNNCDLAAFADRMMNELSGGERQRVVLARALAAETSVLLLDEPTANLDLSHQAMMFRLVRERCRDAGGAAVVITHDLNLAAEFADKAVVLKDGQVVAGGSPADVLTARNLKDAYDVDVLLDLSPASGRTRVTVVY